MGFYLGLPQDNYPGRRPQAPACFKYPKIEILRFERALAILTPELRFRALSIKSIVLRKFRERMVREGRIPCYGCSDILTLRFWMTTTMLPWHVDIGTCYQTCTCQSVENWSTYLCRHLDLGFCFLSWDLLLGHWTCLRAFVQSFPGFPSDDLLTRYRALLAPNTDRFLCLTLPLTVS